MFTLAIISLSLFALNLALCFHKWGIVESYSRYGLDYERAKVKGQLNQWSMLTILSALTMIPPCIELGEGSALQCLCFLVPLNLLIVGFTPDFEKSRKIETIHTIAGALAGLGCIVLAILVYHNWAVLIACISFMAGVGLGNNSLKSCYTLWLELAAYLYVYWTLIAGV